MRRWEGVRLFRIFEGAMGLARQWNMNAAKGQSYLAAFLAPMTDLMADAERWLISRYCSPNWAGTIVVAQKSTQRFVCGYI